MNNVHILQHPLVQHKLTMLRNKETSINKFRQLMRELSLLIGYEVTRTLPLGETEIETPVAKMMAPTIEGKKPVLVSILRAGNGLLDGMLQLMPTAKVGHVGLYRTEGSTVVEYYCKLPMDIHERHTYVLDPMLATGRSVVAAISRLREATQGPITFLCLLAAPEGIAYLHEHFPDVPIHTAALDSHLNEKNYIVPGLGDAGDRLFGTL